MLRGMCYSQFSNRVRNGVISIRHHPYIMSAIDWMGGSRFTDVQYCIYADLTLLESGWVGQKKPKIILI